MGRRGCGAVTVGGEVGGGSVLVVASGDKGWEGMTLAAALYSCEHSQNSGAGS